MFIFAFSAPASFADGRTSLIDQNGYRPFLEGGYGRSIVGIDRLNRFYVYAQAGESIQLASSAMGLSKGDILFERPDGTASSCQKEFPDNPAVGRIHSLEEELRGASGSGGYIPCEISVDEASAGLWEISFIGPDPDSWKSSDPIPVMQPWIQAEDVFTIAAWDINVRGNDGLYKEGRFFFEHLPLSMGDDKAPLFLDLYVLTTDGYEYEVGLTGIQSHNLTLLANKDGFLNTNQGLPIYQSVSLDWANTANKSFPPGITLEGPAEELSQDGKIHKLFLSPPSSDFPQVLVTSGGALDFALEPQIPAKPQSISFSGAIGEGGTFSYQANVQGRYRLEIDVNQNGVWGDGTDVVIHDDAEQGMNFVLWDGIDGEGKQVTPVENGYSVRITHVVGEMHLPFIDIEENAYGVRVKRINGQDASRYTIYYDDSNLFSASEAIDHLDGRQGVDSGWGEHPIIDGFGDGRGIDTWTYSMSEPLYLDAHLYGLEADLRLSITASKITPASGETFEVYLDLRNDGPHTTSKVRVGFNVPHNVEIERIVTSKGEFEPADNSWSIESLPASSEERITLVVSSVEKGAFDIYAEVIDFQGQDLDSSPNNWDIIFSEDPVEDDEDRTQIIVDAKPSLGIAKRVIEQIGDASAFDVSMEILVENLGNTPLENVQIVDLLPDAFHGTDYSLSDVHVSGSLELNPFFDGKTDTNILTPNNTMAIGDRAVVSYKLRVIPFTSLGPYSSSAEVFATGVGQVLSDVSNEGALVDPNENGFPGDAGEDSPTRVEVVQRPAMGVALEVSDVVGQAASFSAKCHVYLENLGDVSLEKVQIELGLAQIFGLNRFEISNIETDSQIEINTNYNGGEDTYLIESETLEINEKAKISFELSATPNENIGEGFYFIQAIGRAESITGVSTEDYSDSGIDPDSNKNRNPEDLGEKDPTVITFDENPVVGASLLAERVTGDLGGFTGYYTLTIKNLGSTPLYDVKATNDLNKVFPGSDVEVIDISALNGITVNQGFDGQANKNLITTQNLPLNPGSSFVLNYVVQVQPQTYFGPYNNSVLVDANSVAGAFTSDISNAGTQIDPDGDGNPDEEGENNFHELRFAPNAAIGAALSVNYITGDLKQFNVSYNILLENKGDVPVRNVSLQQVLDSTFVGAHVKVLQVSTESSLAPNVLFDGVENTELLDKSSSSLEIGESASISVEVQVNPGELFGPYFIGAWVHGETPFGTTVSDASDAGSSSDPNGNGNPSDPGENDPSILSVLEKPVIGATFDAIILEKDAKGFKSRHVIRFENLGDVPLDNFQAELDLSNLYNGADVEVIRRSIRGPLNFYEDYDGIDHVHFIDGLGILDVADTVRVEIDAVIRPKEYSGLYSGNVLVSAFGPGEMQTVDVSDRGSIIDLNQNGLANEVGENRPVELTLGANPSIGAAKMVSRLTELPDRTYEIQYTYLIRNLGDVRLDGITLIEDLVGTFGDLGAGVESISVEPGSPVTINQEFDGRTDQHVIDQSVSALNPGEEAFIFLVVRTTELFEQEEVESNSIVSGKGPAGNEVEDISNNGVYVDPNGNGNAGEDGENIPTPVLFESYDTLGFSSWVSEISGDSLGFTATLNATLSNLGLSELDNVQLTLDLVGPAGGQDVQVEHVSISTNEELSLNEEFNGKTSTNLLNSINSRLKSGSSVHVAVDLAFPALSKTKDFSFELQVENSRGELIERKGGILPIYIETSTGEEAGLESNGDISTLLAERAYRRNRGMASIQMDANKLSYPLHIAGIRGVHGKGSLTEMQNLELVPAEGPDDSEAVVKTPEDLYGVTNATSVLAIDYIARDQQIAGLFATTTPAGETYEHSKNVCDRLKGADLKNVEIISIRGYPFVQSTLVHESGEVDYAISFISYKSDISHLIDSRFIKDEYIVDQISSGEILNFQVWSYNPSYAAAIVDAIVDRMESTGYVDFFNREDEVPEVPTAFVSSGRYDNGSLYLLLKNQKGVTEYRFTGESSRVERGEKEMFEEVFSVPMQYRESEFIPVEIKSGALFDANLYVTNDYNDDVDQVYIADGAWGHIIEDNENVEIDVLDVLIQGEYEQTGGQFFLERGLHFKGSIAEDVLFFRHFKPGGQPINLSEFDYVSFSARGKGDIGMHLDTTGDSEKTAEKKITLGQEAKEHAFLLSEFTNSGTDLHTAISFRFDIESNQDENVELIIEDIYFGQGQPVTNEGVDSPAVFSLGQNYPNPFSGNTTLEFEVPEPAHVRITIFDLLGRRVFDVVDSEYTVGKHKVHVSSDVLASGMYMYKMIANDQVFTQTMHVVR